MIAHLANRFLLLLPFCFGPLAAVSGFAQVTLTKEYIYLGDRILAVESGGAEPASPGNLLATAFTTTQINLSWSAPASGSPHHYGIWRRSGGTLSKIDTASSASYSDTTVTANTAYLYKVSAENSSNQVLGWSNPDLAATVFFNDDPLSAGVTVVQAVHVNQLRTAVNAVRAAAGLSASSWTNGSLTNAWIHAVDVTELRSGLNEALTTFGLTPPNYTDTPLVGVTIKKVHFEQLRQGVK